MFSDAAYLLTRAVAQPRAREGLIDVGRSIRQQAFDARDDFPSIALPALLEKLGDAPTAITVPNANAAWGNSLGGVSPYYYFAAIAATRRPKLSVEIGTFRGLSALTLAMNTAADARIITVDLPDDAADASTLTRGDRTVLNLARGNVGSAFRGTPYESKIEQVLANTLDLDLTTVLGGQSIDLAIIDGGHSYPLVKNDTDKVLANLSPNGVVIWDDYKWNLPGVERCLRDLLGEVPLWRIQGSQYVVHVAGLRAS